MRGSAAGRTTSQVTCRSLAPRFRADHTSSRPTSAAPARVAVRTGNTASKTITAIFEASWNPSQSVTMGKNAIFGMGKPTETTGSRNHLTARERCASMPRTTPPAAAMPKPASVRQSVAPALRASSPERPSSAMRPSTAWSGGSMKGVTTPARAIPSQAAARARTGSQGARSPAALPARARRAAPSPLSPPTGSSRARGAGRHGRPRTPAAPPSAPWRTSRRTRRPRRGSR